MNRLPCEKCQHFDPQFKIINGKRRLTWYGFCGVKSVYAAKEQDGQVFPEGVERVAEGEMARMVPVKRDGVVTDCLQALKKL